MIVNGPLGTTFLSHVGAKLIWIDRYTQQIAILVYVAANILLVGIDDYINAKETCLPTSIFCCQSATVVVVMVVRLMRFRI